MNLTDTNTTTAETGALGSPVLLLSSRCNMCVISLDFFFWQARCIILQCVNAMYCSCTARKKVKTRFYLFIYFCVRVLCVSE